VDRPNTRYARSGDLRIAYQVHGSGAHDILFLGATQANLETAWQFPEAARLFERLGRFARVIRFDRRDHGLSDATEDLTLEAFADDALAVMDAVGAERPVLLGALDGARSLAVLASTRPDRVGALIALSPSARSLILDDEELASAVTKAAAEGDLAASAGLLAPRYTADPARSDRLTRSIQSTVTPLQAERFMRMTLASDVTAVLPLVQAPALVLHPVDSAIPADSAREFADLIPGARFQGLPGADLFIYVLDPDPLADLIEQFVTGSAPAPITNRVLATVLFTDVVDSTRHAAHTGDRVWSGILDRHLAATQATVAAHDGQMIKTTGDGVLALFTGPAHGVRCAERIRAEASALGLELRAGVHTGEVERSSDDVSGLAVALAARITSLAGAGEILVSRTVKDLVIGSELTFTDRGEHQLKGIPDRWSIYGVAADHDGHMAY
jgi:class 3 adenylate cyclase